jgi:hypothetical protein
MSGADVNRRSPIAGSRAAAKRPLHMQRLYRPPPSARRQGDGKGDELGEGDPAQPAGAASPASASTRGSGHASRFCVPIALRRRSGVRTVGSAVLRCRSVHAWTCPGCGTIHDRDKNAVQNIGHEAERIWALGTRASAVGGNLRRGHPRRLARPAVAVESRSSVL